MQRPGQTSGAAVNRGNNEKRVEPIDRKKEEQHQNKGKQTEMQIENISQRSTCCAIGRGKKGEDERPDKETRHPKAWVNIFHVAKGGSCGGPWKGGWKVGSDGCWARHDQLGPSQ